jgi:hypothetical protein
LVSCGYSQIPGVDFNESFAPVVNDVIFRIILTAKLLWDLQASIVDVETAFLHGDLQEEIYMNVHKGMSQDDNTFLLLKKTIYGLVQSAREFYNKLLSTLKSMGFTENKSDPCLLTRCINCKVIIIRIYVDDCLVVGKEDHIQEVIQGLKANGFNLKVESSLKDYLSYRVIEDLESKSILILQPHLINNLEAKFGKEVCNKRVYKAPGTLTFKIVCPAADDDVIDADLQGRYQSSVGMLLYLTNYSQPDLFNVVRKLVKCMDKATKGTYLEMFLRVVKFVIDTKNFCLQIKPEFKGKIGVYECFVKVIGLIIPKQEPV